MRLVPQLACPRDARDLACTRCGILVRLFEPQGPDPLITPDTFVGLCCMKPVVRGRGSQGHSSEADVRAAGRPALVGGRATPSAESLPDTTGKRPLAADIREYIDTTFGSAA